MKSIKTVAVLFLITCAMCMMNVKADSLLGFANITLPAFSKAYTSGFVTKKTISEQYVKNNGAYDKVSGDTRTVGARLKGITTSYTSLTKGSYTQLNSGNTSLGTLTGSYQLQVRATKSTLTTVSFSGTWILDDYLK